MLDAAICQELGEEKANDAEAVYHTLGTLLSRLLLAQLGISRNGGDQAFCKGPGICRPTGTVLITVPLKIVYACEEPRRFMILWWLADLPLYDFKSG
jgi:hypothetical protein